MSSPLAALIWEIWRRGRRSAFLALGCVGACALINLATPERLRVGEPAQTLFPALFGLLMVVSFFLIMGIFNYTEYSGEWSGFPHRLFTLPVRTWRLVAMPTILGIVAVELVYFAWIKFVWTRENILMPEWFAVVLGAYMIFYQCALWSLAGFRVARILVLSVGGTSSIAVACLPFSPTTAPSPWFSEKRLTAIIAGMALMALGVAWAAVARQRSGGGRRQGWFKTQLEGLTDALPRRSNDFTSPAAAQFWFEWRRAGLLLPACAALALVTIIGPFSWVFRADPRSTMDILLRALGLPIILAFAIGKGFVKPEFWSANLSMPPFLATRPLPSGEFVISKMKVAALSVVIAWLLVLGFIALWLPLWADTTQQRLLGRECRLFYPHSWLVITVLYLAGFVVLTWRCLVGGLWAGLSGNRSYYLGALGLQVLVPALLLLIAGICSDTIDLAIREHPDRLKSVALSVMGWLLALAVIVKFWFAFYSWSKISPHRTRQYLLVWSGATICFIALGVLSRPWPDVYRLEHLYVLAALLLFPFARLGLAPLSLAKNRHG